MYSHAYIHIIHVSLYAWFAYIFITMCILLYDTHPYQVCRHIGRTN